MSKYKLDLATVLNAIDRKDRKFFANLSAEEKKAFGAIVMMRFTSSAVRGMEDFALIATNEVANKHFFELYEHPELQYLLLTAASSGRNTRHPWIAGAKQPGGVLLANFISRFWPEANRMEREAILNQFDQKSFAVFVDGSGVDKEEAKKIKQSFKAR